MRRLVLSLLSSAALIAGCATPTMTSCEISNVPAGAVFGVRAGMDIATWPASAPSGGTGCQRIWYGEQARPEAMQVLATYHYEAGQVRRLVGRVPGGSGYDCRYRDGALDPNASQNPAQCPKSSDMR